MEKSNNIGWTDLWKDKSHSELEQEIINLRHMLIKEKHKRIEELFSERLFIATIVFLTLAVIIFAKLEYTGWGLQWLCIILFIFGGLVVLGLICRSYYRGRDYIEKFESDGRSIFHWSEFDYKERRTNLWV